MEDGVTEAQSILYPNKQQQEEEGKGEDKPSGSVNVNVSSLVSSINVDEVKEEKGILDNIISHLISPLSPKPDPHRVRSFQVQEEEDEKVKSGEEEGGGGIIDNIVSHFPTSLPDGAAPTTDEASILIHSIVRD